MFAPKAPATVSDHETRKGETEPILLPFVVMGADAMVNLVEKLDAQVQTQETPSVHPFLGAMEIALLAKGLSPSMMV